MPCLLVAAALAGCGPDYSPNTYATSAVQQANKVDQGVIVGVRDVAVSASGTTGAVTGAAAGGIAASQVPGSSVTQAFSALGGSLVGGLVGTAAEHATADTKAYEYIVRKPNGDLLSVTQKDEVPLQIGQKVLLIGGNQARIVPDYTIATDQPKTDKSAAPTETAPKPGPIAETPLPAPASAASDGAPAPDSVPVPVSDPTRFVKPPSAAGQATQTASPP